MDKRLSYIKISKPVLLITWLVLSILGFTKANKTFLIFNDVYKNKKASKPLCFKTFSTGAGNRGRTCMPSAQEPKSCVSANSTIPAQRYYIISNNVKCQPSFLYPGSFFSSAFTSATGKVTVSSATLKFSKVTF